MVEIGRTRVAAVAVGVLAVLSAAPALAQAESLGSNNPRLKIWATNGHRTVGKALVNYHCVPWQDGEEVCKDGVSGPHRTAGRRLRVTGAVTSQFAPGFQRWR